MRYIDIKKELLQVLQTVLTEIGMRYTHLKPILYNDHELQFISEELVQGIDDFIIRLRDILLSLNVQALLHDEVFGKFEIVSKQFEVVVIKTNVLYNIHLYSSN